MTGCDNAADVRERPILFSGPMVRAIIDGRKTQTRRVVKDCKLAPLSRAKSVVEIESGYWGFNSYAGDAWRPNRDGDSMWTCSEICPYGKPGDQLYVREAWYYDIPPHKLPKDRPDWFEPDSMYYRADGECCEQIPECQCYEVGPTPWRPSIHLPRWASRITLEVVRVRVERLCSISGVDAVAEGYECDFPGGHHGAFARAREAFLAGEWAAPLRDMNPWVWVVEFKRL